MTQMGRTVTVIAADQGEKTCTPVDESYWCNPTAAADDVALTLAQQRDGEVRNVINQVSGPDASHRLYPLERVEVEMELDLSLVAAAAAEPTSTTGSDCWEARAVKGDHGHRWGRRAQFCFDRVTGALVFRRVFGESRIEVFVADTVVTAAELTIDDLNPR